MALPTAKKFLKYLNASPSPWHAVNEAANILKSSGYQELKEASTQPWNLQKNGKYFVRRHGSALWAFAIGGKFEPATTGRFSMIGAHTDSPCIRIKPVSKIEKNKFLQIGVECYGGGTWPTWFDRDLRLAGRVNYRDEQGKIQHDLVHIDKPLCRIPTIAIHLNREQGTKLELNKENHLNPILSTSIENAVAKDLNQPSSDIKRRHHPSLLDLIEKESGIKADSITEFELCLADYQKAEIGGINEEFIYGPRLDNLLSSWTCLEALINSEASLANDEACRIITLFDHEEIGSRSAQGADGALPAYILKRILHGVDPNADSCCFERSIPKSFCISADMAHAIHPNYSEKHEGRMPLSLTGGPAIKFNTNQRYATNSQTASLLRLVAEKANVPLQEICNRNDVPCGSTIGPITAGGLAIPTVDLGAPQLSMHSIREMCHVVCVQQCVDLFEEFFNTYQNYDVSDNYNY